MLARGWLIPGPGLGRESCQRKNTDALKWGTYLRQHDQGIRLAVVQATSTLDASKTSSPGPQHPVTWSKGIRTRKESIPLDQEL